MMLDKLVLALVIIGALNWGSIGIFQFDLVAALFGGQAALLSRIVYTLVALAGVWAISFFSATPRSATRQHENDIYRKNPRHRLFCGGDFFFARVGKRFISPCVCTTDSLTCTYWRRGGAASFRCLPRCARHHRR